jgi:hypothetical protein
MARINPCPDTCLSSGEILGRGLLSSGRDPWVRFLWRQGLKKPVGRDFFRNLQTRNLATRGLGWATKEAVPQKKKEKANEP